MVLEPKAGARISRKRPRCIDGQAGFTTPRLEEAAGRWGPPMISLVYQYGGVHHGLGWQVGQFLISAPYWCGERIVVSCDQIPCAPI